MVSNRESVFVNTSVRTFNPRIDLPIFGDTTHIKMNVESYSSSTGSKRDDWFRLTDVRITSQVDIL